MLLAAATKTPEIELSKEESAKLADATANVARHYNIRTQQKTMDWANLFIAMGVTYGPRAYMIRARQRQENAITQPPAVNGHAPEMAFAH